MARNRVNHVPEVKSCAGQGAGLLELWDGAGQVVWYHVGVCGLSAARGQFGEEYHYPAESSLILNWASAMVI